MKIPTRIKMLGRNIKVKFVKDLTRRNDTNGETHYRFDEILIQKNVEGTPRSDTQTGITFLHELLHWSFYVMGEQELNDNEKLVTNMAEVLYQVLAKNDIDLRDGRYSEK